MRRNYLPTPERISIISSLPFAKSILDLGCGEGIYIPYLRGRAELVVGVDKIRERCLNAHSLGCDVIQADASALPFTLDAFNMTWACEVIEHTPTLSVFDEIERVTENEIIATMPNPHGPYYWMDSEHILKYNVRGLRRFLSSRKNWRYEIHGLGLTMPIKSISVLLNLIARLTRRFPYVALTILIRGMRRR